MLCYWGENSCLKRPDTLAVAAEIQGPAEVQGDVRVNTEGFRNLRQVTRNARQCMYLCKQSARRSLAKTGVVSGLTSANLPVVRRSSATANTCPSHISQCTSHNRKKQHLLRSLFHKSHSPTTAPWLEATLTQPTAVKTVLLQPLAAVITKVCRLWNINGKQTRRFLGEGKEEARRGLNSYIEKSFAKYC